MEDHPNCILDWPYLHREKSMEELTQSLWLTTMELEATRVRVQEEIQARDDQLNQVKDLLNDAINKRNEARNKYQSLLLDKLLLQQARHHRRCKLYHSTPAPPHSGGSSVEDEPVNNCGCSSSDCEESIVSSPPIENLVQMQPTPVAAAELWCPVIPTKGLPEKGKFLEAVMKAGPLLQNLLLAGTLPHWRHPPPPLDAYQIPLPPLVISAPPLHHLFSCSEFNKKRGFSEDSVSSTETKYQKIS